MKSLKASLQEKEDKYSKMVKTLKTAKSMIDTLKAEKDQVHDMYVCTYDMGSSCRNFELNFTDVCFTCINLFALHTPIVFLRSRDL